MPAMTAATAVSCVHTMFSGVAGSEEQRQASQWALAFQDAAEAWLVCLELLRRTPAPDGSDVALFNFAAQVRGISVHVHAVVVSAPRCTFVCAATACAQSQPRRRLF